MGFFFADERKVELSENKKRNGRIEPMYMVADKKKFSVFRNIFFSGNMDFYPENFNCKKCGLDKNMIIISVLLFDWFV